MVNSASFDHGAEHLQTHAGPAYGTTGAAVLRLRHAKHHQQYDGENWNTMTLAQGYRSEWYVRW